MCERSVASKSEAEAPIVLGLYFYRARRAVLRPDADLRDASCRPDPDFDALTLGLCRPGLRAKVARLSRSAEPLDLLFYSIGSKKDCNQVLTPRPSLSAIDCKTH